MNDQWVLLWSQSQCAFHIEQVKDMLKANAAAFNEDRRMDYVVLHIGTDDGCRAVAARYRPTMHKRQEARALAWELIDRGRA